MLPTDQEVAEAKSKPASEMPCLDEGPYFSALEASRINLALRQIHEIAAAFDKAGLDHPMATPCRQRD